MKNRKNGSDLGVPRPKKSGSVSGSKSSPKKAPGFPPTTSREQPHPMYAVRWNALLDILTDITIEQADRERSGHAWGQDTINKLDALRDPIAKAKATTPNP